MKPAGYWHTESERIVRCELCPHRCRIKPGNTGICGVRENQDGVLQSLVYFVASGSAMDPVEKKPLYHFFPGSTLLSLGSYGCNLACRCCQNYTISKEFSRANLGRSNFSVASVLNALPELASPLDLLVCCGVAYTYNEPTVWIETVRELAQAVRARGYKNVMVTNGYIQPEPLEDVLEVVDAFNIDLKAFREEAYARHCGGALAPVLRTIRRAATRAHVELTMLVVPGLNDDASQVRDMRDWIANEIGPRTPVHISRYFPTYRATQPATSAATLRRTRELLREKLAYVYVGNTGEDQATICASCGAVALERRGYTTHRIGVRDDGACRRCGAPVAVGVSPSAS
jgi:pyruvate formate lyase activating enzyme